MIEMITNAETLRKIQVEYGLTGSFKVHKFIFIKLNYFKN